jgi:flagellar biosynthesis/type III secretory pathway protein FliH
VRLRARFAWWVFERISDWLDAPEPTEEELEAADRHAAAEQRAFENELWDARAEGYAEGRRDAAGEGW